jgi:GT2 family glycosyltransferase
VAVARNDWRAAEVAAANAAENPTLRASIVIPAHNSQTELELTLASLANQDYPSELVEVIVVDDRSQPPLALPFIRPTSTRIITVEGAGHGSGVGRHAGALQATGDFILFLDSDIITGRSHVSAHARWHAALRDAVVLGTREFIDPTGVTVDEVVDAVRADDLARIRPGAHRDPHAWIEAIFERTQELTTDRDDLWRPVVGASVSLRRDFYGQIGGFAPFHRWGIVDIEFGYRAFTAGGVIIPERQAHSLHQGPRTASLRGPELTALRAPLIANHVAHKRYRPPVPGRRWVVPEAGVFVDATTATFAETQRTVDDILAGSFTDLVVDVIVGERGDTDLGLIWDYWAMDNRVSIVEQARDTAFPSPATIAVTAGTRFDRDAIATLVRELKRWTSGLVTVHDTKDLVAEAWATRALLRSARARTSPGGLRAVARELFGETALMASAVGVGSGPGASERFLRDDLFFPPEPTKTRLSARSR